MPDLLTAALEYANQGIAVIPCQPRGKKPALAATGKNHSIATSDSNQITQWWTGNPDYNIGIPGTPNQLAVIDIDGDTGIEWIQTHQLPMPPTWTAKTANGYHYYYRWPAGLEIRTCDIAPQLEIRAAGAYTIAPPSIHPNGDTYQWGPQRGNWGALPELPPEWAALTPQPANNVLDGPWTPPPTPPAHIGPWAQTALRNAVARMAHATAGNRHKTLIAEALNIASLIKGGELPETALNQLAEVAHNIEWPDRTRNEITDAITYALENAQPQHHRTGHPYQPPNPYTLPASETPQDTGDTDPRDLEPTDLDALSRNYHADQQWLIEPIIPSQRQAALYAQGKTGKSLLALDLTAAAASGKPILGGPALENPVRTLYLDKEMTGSDLQERLHNLGHHHDDPHWPLIIENLIYYQHKFPYYLDTPEGGDVLLHNALRYNTQLVVVDTLIRTVKGEENSADTIRDFNLHTGQRLKEAGIALLRIDHAGKDLTKGQRGTSAKVDDVDVVWNLRAARYTGLDGAVTRLDLIRDAARTDWIPTEIHLERHQGPPLRHSIPLRTALSHDDIELVRYVQRHGLWRDNVTVRAFLEDVHAGGFECGTDRGAGIVKWMKQYGNARGTRSGTREETEVHTQSGYEVQAEVQAEASENAQVRGRFTRRYARGTGERGGERGEVQAEAHTQSGYEVQAEVQAEASENAQVRGRFTRRYARGTKKPGEGTIVPPLRGGQFPPQHSDEEEELPIPW